MRVEKALKGVKGVKSATVNLEHGTAEVEVKKEIPLDVFKSAIEEAGYSLVKSE
jgi:copper chaperone CopZ